MSLSYHVFRLLRSLSISVPLTLIFVDNVAYMAKVEGVSMQPTLNDDSRLKIDDISKINSTFHRYIYKYNSSDIVFLSHLSTRNYHIQRGDVVALISPKNPSQILIKRVIGLEGNLTCN